MEENMSKNVIQFKKMYNFFQRYFNKEKKCNVTLSDGEGLIELLGLFSFSWEMKTDLLCPVSHIN